MTDPEIVASAAAGPLIIAEAGVNHNGERARALDLVAAAAAAGADVVKFQTFRAEELAGANAKAAAYQKRNVGQDSQREMLRGLELDDTDFAAIAEACAARGIEFLSTCFDPAAVPAMRRLGMRRIKVPSGELTNDPALEAFAATGLPVILSTGMADLAEVEHAVGVLRGAGVVDLTVLQCTSIYPAPPTQTNLRAMTTMARAFDVPVGYSDHTLDDHIAIAAVALGATVIEKHFTLDRALPGPDHAASLEPDELAAMVRRLREAHAALGDGVKAPLPEEVETARMVRRSWHAARDLAAGAVIGAGDVRLCRPADGLAPGASPVGRRLRAALPMDAPVTADLLAGLPGEA